MKSVIVICSLLVLHLLSANAQFTGANLAAGLIGAKVGAIGVGLLARAAGRRFRGGYRGGYNRRRYGRDLSHLAESDENEQEGAGMVQLAALQDTSECAHKLICLLAAADSVSAMEAAILEVTQLDTPTSFLAALQAGAERGAADCAAAYRHCPKTRSQLSRYASDVISFSGSAKTEEA